MRRDSENDRKSDCGFDELDEVMREVRSERVLHKSQRIRRERQRSGSPNFRKEQRSDRKPEHSRPDSRFADEAIIKILPDVLRETEVLSEKLGYEVSSLKKYS